MPRTTSVRRVGLVLAAALALSFLPAAADALVVDAGTDDVRAVIDLSGATDRTTTVQAASVPAQATGIGPGSHLFIEMDGGLYGCTASWVFTDGVRLLLGAAGHCFLPEGTTATHGDDADWQPSGTKVRVCVSACSFGGVLGFMAEGDTVELGPLVYARQEQERGGEQLGWDFGVVEVPTDLHHLVRTDMPVFGGPTETATLGTSDVVCHYGYGVVGGEVWPTMARSGLGLLSDDEVWFAASPAAPGDSGSAVQTCAPGSEGLEGVAAIGTLTHLTTLGVAGTTNDQSLAMAADDAGLVLDLVLGELPELGPPGGGGDDGGGDDDTGGGDTGGGKDKGDKGKRPDHAGGKGKPSE
jgi:hypothetical protein